MNAVWDLYAKLEGKPLWKLLVDMSPEEIVSCVDFRYIDDALTPDEAIELLRRQQSTKAEREEILLRDGFPAYTTSAGWIGYPEEVLPALAEAAVAAGFTHLKVKVGADLGRDLRRATIVRGAIGPNLKLSLDANQAWGVGEAIAAMEPLAEVEPWWIEEPTSPDDVLGHRRIKEAVAPVDQDDPPAGGGESLGARAPDAARGAGDERGRGSNAFGHGRGLYRAGQ